MTLFIACLLIYMAKLNVLWYPIAFSIWFFHLGFHAK
jgi:hypothetical protein